MFGGDWLFGNCLLHRFFERIRHRQCFLAFGISCVVCACTPKRIAADHRHFFKNNHFALRIFCRCNGSRESCAARTDDHEVVVFFGCAAAAFALRRNGCLERCQIDAALQQCISDGFLKGCARHGRTSNSVHVERLVPEYFVCQLFDSHFTHEDCFMVPRHFDRSDSVFIDRHFHIEIVVVAVRAGLISTGFKFNFVSRFAASLCQCRTNGKFERIGSDGCTRDSIDVCAVCFHKSCRHGFNGFRTDTVCFPLCKHLDGSDGVCGYGDLDFDRSV